MFRIRLDVPSPAPERVRVEGPALHHLRVARVVPGEALEVFDGRGRAWGAWLESLDEGAAVLRLGDARRSPTGRTIVLLQGFPKGDKLELVLQKSTELGVSAVWPVLTARSVARPKQDALGARHARWQRIVEEAARQSGRADVPEVAPLRPARHCGAGTRPRGTAARARRGGAGRAAGTCGGRWRGGAGRRPRGWARPRGGRRAACGGRGARLPRTARAPDRNGRARSARRAPAPRRTSRLTEQPLRPSRGVTRCLAPRPTSAELDAR